MEVKIWMDGYQRIVCGVTDQTTCQDVIVTLAQAAGMTGRYAMYERWKTTERRLQPTERPVLVLQRWGEYSNDVQLIIRRYGPSGGRKRLSPSQDLERSVLSGGTTLKKSLTFTGAHRRSRSMDQWSESRVGVRDYSRSVESSGRSSVASRSSEIPSSRVNLERQDSGESGIYRLCPRRRSSAIEWKQTSSVASEFTKVSENAAAFRSPKVIQRRMTTIVNIQRKLNDCAGSGVCSVGAGGSGGYGGTGSAFFAGARGTGLGGAGGSGSSGGTGSAFFAGGTASGPGGAGGSRGGTDAGGVVKSLASISKAIADKELSFNGTKMVRTNDNTTDMLRYVSISRTISNRSGSTSNSSPFSTALKHPSDRSKKLDRNRNMDHTSSSTSSPERASTLPSKSVELSSCYRPIKDKNAAEVANKTKHRDFEIKEIKHRKLQRTAHELLFPTITTKMSVQDVNFCDLRNCHAADVSNTSYKVPSLASEVNSVRHVESFANPVDLEISEEETVLKEDKQRMALMELIDAQDRELLECNARLRQLNHEILLLEGDSEANEKLEELDPLRVESKLDMERQRESKPQTEETEKLAAELVRANIESRTLERKLESVKQEIGTADRCLSRRREDLAELERQLKGFNLDLFLKKHIRPRTNRRGLPSVVVSAKMLPCIQHQSINTIDVSQNTSRGYVF